LDDSPLDARTMRMKDWAITITMRYETDIGGEVSE
jgi:hypothetical protein